MRNQLRIYLQAFKSVSILDLDSFIDFPRFYGNWHDANDLSVMLVLCYLVLGILVLDFVLYVEAACADHHLLIIR